MNKRANEWREKIVELLGEVEDVNVLIFIYNLICSFKKKWGV